MWMCVWQVEELHRQQQQGGVAPMSQITAQQIQQLQQQHSQLGLPPLQPAQLQQMLQEQQQQHQQLQQQQQQSGDGLVGLHVGQVVVPNNQAMHSLMMGLTGVSTTALATTMSMTPGLPGGVLSSSQQLPLGSSTTTTTTSPAPSTVNPVLSAAGLPSVSSSSGLMSLTREGVTEGSTLSLGEHLGIQDPALSQLMGGFESVMSTDLLPQPHSAGFGEDLDFPHHNPFTSGEATAFSLPTGLDSIKQDVMLSSAVNAQPAQPPRTTALLDRLGGSLDSGTKTAASQGAHTEIRRRLSGDLDLSRKSPDGLTITHLLNRVATQTAKKEEGGAASQPSRVRMRSKSGDVTKLMRSKSVDHSLMRQRSNTEESVYRSRKRSGDETFIGRAKGDDYLSQSDGASVFRNPGSLLPSPFKMKRKNRPSPLFIPPTLSSFQSRLRSPRIWDGGEGKGGRGHTPPPYTPPPMLSPVRSGSGLFCSMQGTRPLTPQSAPISARLALSRRGELDLALLYSS
jgi:hypothetical protein